MRGDDDPERDQCPGQGKMERDRRRRGRRCARAISPPRRTGSRSSAPCASTQSRRAIGPVISVSAVAVHSHQAPCDRAAKVTQPAAVAGAVARPALVRNSGLHSVRSSGQLSSARTLAMTSRLSRTSSRTRGGGGHPEAPHPDEAVLADATLAHQVPVGVGEPFPRADPLQDRRPQRRGRGSDGPATVTGRAQPSSAGDPTRAIGTGSPRLGKVTLRAATSTVGQRPAAQPGRDECHHGLGRQQNPQS